MLHRYFPHTADDIGAMLDACGMKSLDELYSDVPDALLLKRGYELPDEMSEMEVRDFFARLGSRNRHLACFAGAGYYDHYTPAVVGHILSRSEFLTAYTPYQPEVSQGTLQYIFEYQSMMAELTGLDVSNASMYDGATATAEAMLMTVAAARKRTRVLASATLLPQVLAVMATYARYHGVTLDLIPEKDGVTSREAMEAMLDQGDVAGVVIPSPNRYGIMEDYTGWSDTIHAAKALLVMNAPASPLGVIRTPGEWGADIASGDAQSLGMPLDFGGPYLGYLCCTKALMRKMPGRIVGATTDADGRRVFVLTLQAREQHIRREKATSNICSNQGLMALFVTVYLSLLGAKGLERVNEIGYAHALDLARRLEATGRMKLKYPGAPFLNEFVMVTSVDVDTIMKACVDRGILPGVKLADRELLIAVTETVTKEQMDKYVEAVESL